MSTEITTEMPAMGETMPVVLTVPEAAVLLGMSRRSCYRAVEADAIPYLKVGRRIMIPTARLLTQLGLPLDRIAWDARPPTSSAGGRRDDPRVAGDVGVDASRAEFTGLQASASGHPSALPIRTLHVPAQL